jgi:hypothetical protein
MRSKKSKSFLEISERDSFRDESAHVMHERRRRYR